MWYRIMQGEGTVNPARSANPASHYAYNYTSCKLNWLCRKRGAEGENLGVQGLFLNILRLIVLGQNIRPL